MSRKNLKDFHSWIPSARPGAKLFPCQVPPVLESGHRKKRVMGIEPTYPAWKAGVLPLNYTRIASDLFDIKYRNPLSYGLRYPKSNAEEET